MSDTPELRARTRICPRPDRRSSRRRSSGSPRHRRSARSSCRPSGRRRSSASRRMPAGSASSPSSSSILSCRSTGSTSSGSRSGCPNRGSTGDRGPAGHQGRARLQHLPGQLRALPRRERRGRDRSGPEPPGQAVRPSQRELPADRAHGRWPIRVRQPGLADAGVVRHRPTRRVRSTTGPIDELVAFLRATNEQEYIVRDPELLTPEKDPVTGEIKTFTGWRDPNYTPAPDATPFPACYLDEFTSAAPSASGSGDASPSRPAPVTHRPSRRPAHPAVPGAPWWTSPPRGRSSRRPMSPPRPVRRSRSTSTTRTRAWSTTWRSSTAAAPRCSTATSSPASRRRTTPSTALAAGTYKFVCSVHANMTGSLTAQ